MICSAALVYDWFDLQLSILRCVVEAFHPSLVSLWIHRSFLMTWVSQVLSWLNRFFLVFWSVVLYTDEFRCSWTGADRQQDLFEYSTINHKQISGKMSVHLYFNAHRHVVKRTTARNKYIWRRSWIYTWSYICAFTDQWVKHNTT